MQKRVVTTQKLLRRNKRFCQPLLSVALSKLPSSLFIRVHRSFIIIKSHITHIEGNRVFVNNIEIPIGINYKEAFLKALGI